MRFVAQSKRDYLSVFGDQYPTSDGTPVRDYVHVVDLGQAHALALNHLREGGASQYINLGNGQGYSVLEVIETARHVTGRTIEACIEAPRAGNPFISRAQGGQGRRYSRVEAAVRRFAQHCAERMGLAPAASQRIRRVRNAIFR